MKHNTPPIGSTILIHIERHFYPMPAIVTCSHESVPTFTARVIGPNPDSDFVASGLTVDGDSFMREDGGKAPCKTFGKVMRLGTAWESRGTFFVAGQIFPGEGSWLQKESDS